jgi:hypothetical protein
MEYRFKLLFLGIAFYAVGMLSFTIPFIGEFSDVVWAPISGFLMTKMYKGRVGRIGGIISFAEEFLPFTDLMPSFTLVWFYIYVIKNES